ncbi:MAG: ECF transporter S component [Firmicutes bacterium]|nr:ECF transporter S component [Bacillota bacterium]
MSQKKPFFSVSNLVLIAMFGAMAFILMYLEFPLLFLAPNFYKMDFSELPVLIGSFALGPVAGIVIEALKIVLKLLFKPTSTAYIGELANFLVGCALVVPAGIIYKMNHTRKGALLGMIAGTVCMAIAGALLNAFLLLPWYITNFFGGSADVLIQMGQAVHKSVNSVATFAILLVVPFNLFKAIVISILTLLLYKHVSRLIQTTIKKNER